jgi:hypothetical protein
MAGFVEVLGFDAMEQKTINAAFSISLRREMVYAKWRPGTALPNIILFDGDNNEVLKELFSRSFEEEIALVSVSQLSPALLTCFHVERPIRLMRLLQTLDDGMCLNAEKRKANVHAQFGDTTMPVM